MKVSSWLNVWSKSSWGSSNTFGRNIILNKQLIPNKKSKQHQTKNLSHKAKKSWATTQLRSKSPLENRMTGTKNGKTNAKNSKLTKINTLKTSERPKQHLKKPIKNADPKLWVKFVLAWRTKFRGQPLKTIIKPQLSSIAKNFHHKKVKSAQKRETETLRH